MQPRSPLGSPVPSVPAARDRTVLEIDHLRHHAQMLAQGQGAIAVWFGPAGSGKTRLLYQAAAVVTEAVPHVRTVQIPGNTLQNAPVAAVAMLVAQTLDLAPSEDTAVLEAAVTNAMPRSVADPDVVRRTLAVARAAATSRPLLVLIDDLPAHAFEHLSDLSILAARLAELPVLVLATSGCEPPDGASLVGLGPLWLRRVEPMGEVAAWDLATTYGAGFVPPSVAARIRTAGGGRPGDIAQIVRTLGPEELRGGVPLPTLPPLSTGALQEARAWLSGLDQKHRRLLLAAATSPFGDRDLLEDAFDAAFEDCGTSPEDRWFVADGPRFRFADERHRIALETVAVRRDILAAHRTLAASLPEGSPKRAWRSLQAGDGITAAEGATLADVARQELDTGDLEVALRLATDLLPHVEGELRTGLLCTLGLAAMHLGHLDTAYEHLTMALPTAQDPELLGTTACALVLTLLGREGSLPVTLVDSVIERLRAQDPSWALRLSSLTARAHHFAAHPLTVSPGQRPDVEGRLGPVGRRYLDLAREIAEDVDDPSALYGLRFTEAFLTYGNERFEADFAERLGSALVRSDVIGWDRAASRLELATMRGEYEVVAHRAPDTRLRLEAHDSPFFKARIVCTELRALLDLGSVQRAVALASDHMFVLPLHLVGPGLGVVLVAEALTYAGLEDAAAPWVTASRLASHAYTTPFLRARVPVLLALRAEFTGDMHTAWEQSTAALLHLRGLDMPPWHPVRVHHLEYEYLTGQHVAAEADLDEIDASAPTGTSDAFSDTFYALARAFTGPADDVVARIEEVARRSEEIASPLVRAQALIAAMRALDRVDPAAYAEQVARLGSDVLAGERSLTLSRFAAVAVAAARSAGAEALVPVVRRTGPGTGTRVPRTPVTAAAHRTRDGGDALTPEERTVAQMVVAGASNKQVAAALFISVRTVELRLTSIYRKLGIASRKELPRAMAARDSSPGGATPPVPLD